MKVSNERILSVPTNIISGFLGAGKTSAILHLLNQKPSNERWAILVNEFGEIGIDGTLFSGLLNNKNNIFIKEIPGGCMCCSSSLPMQIALNQLLKEARPHRLLIEPTGLGHPQEVLQLLSNEYYQKSLILEKTLTLVDARHLDDCRYTENTNFNQQLELADVIIGNKVDLYQIQDKEALSHYIRDSEYTPEQLHFVKHAKVKLEWLAGKTHYINKRIEQRKQHHLNSTTHDLNISPAIPDPSFIKMINQGEGYQSIGWRIVPSKVFNRASIKVFLTNIVAIRVKAIFITHDGIYAYNNASDGLQEVEIDKCNESRIEIICDKINETWEKELKQALTYNHDYISR
jgi:G3E family GTPase